MSMMNRLANVHNRFQGKHLKVLTVCSAGLLRSPTIARVLTKDFDNVNCRSVGVSQEYALIPIDEAHVEWADVIICADHEHADVIERDFDQFFDVGGNFVKPLVILELPDKFPFADPELEELIRHRINKAIDEGHPHLSKLESNVTGDVASALKAERG